MTTSQPKCPNCSGQLGMHIVGELQDKWLRCPYCGYTVDIPDSFEKAHVEETVQPDGTYRRVETTQRRDDRTGDVAAPPTGLPGIDPAALAALGLDPDSLRCAGGTRITISDQDPGDLADAIERATGSALPQEFRDMLQSGAVAPGKSFTSTRTTTETRVCSGSGPERAWRGLAESLGHPSTGGTGRSLPRWGLAALLIAVVVVIALAWYLT